MGRKYVAHGGGIDSMYLGKPEDFENAAKARWEARYDAIMREEAKTLRDSNERDKGMFDHEEGGGAESDGKGASNPRRPLDSYPTTVT